MKPARHRSVTMAAGSVGLDGWGRRREEIPRMVRLTIMPASPAKRSGLRPTLSMILMAINVMPTFTAPMARLA